MDTQKLKQVIQKAGFSKKVEEDILSIIDQSQGNFSDDQLQKILQLIDFDVESSHIEANMLEQVALEFENFATSTENAAKLASHKLDEATEDVEKYAKSENINLVESADTSEQTMPESAQTTQAVQEEVSPSDPIQETKAEEPVLSEQENAPTASEPIQENVVQQPTQNTDTSPADTADTPLEV